MKATIIAVILSGPCALGGYVLNYGQTAMHMIIYAALCGMLFLGGALAARD